MEQESISLRVFRNFPYKICPTADGSRTKPRGDGFFNRVFRLSGYPPVSSGGLPESCLQFPLKQGSLLGFILFYKVIPSHLIIVGDLCKVHRKTHVGFANPTRYSMVKAMGVEPMFRKVVIAH